MRLRINNVAKLRQADIDIAGITVIAGENDTGKSTVGKVLYSILDSLRKTSERAKEDRHRSIIKFIAQAYLGIADSSDDDFNRLKSFAEKIENNHVMYAENKKLLENDVKKWYAEQGGGWSAELTNSIVDNVYSVLTLSDADYRRTILGRKLNVEFNRQINNVFNDGEANISLDNGKQRADIVVGNNAVKFFEANFEYKSSLVYIDNPFVLDEISNSASMYTKRLTSHKDELIKQLSLDNQNKNVFEELVVSKNMEYIQQKLRNICHGDIIRDNNSDWQYKLNNSEKNINVNSLSAGLKTFVILKQLILSGTLGRGSCVILDEPEIHLHPEWQLVFAELIVLLCKEFKLDIVLNTHSPYFLNAIEVYSAKHGITDACRYYLSRNEGDFSYIDDVTDDVEQIYKKLARPLQILEDVRYNDV